MHYGIKNTHLLLQMPHSLLDLPPLIWDQLYSERHPRLQGVNNLLLIWVHCEDEVVLAVDQPGPEAVQLEGLLIRGVLLMVA